MARVNYHIVCVGAGGTGGNFLKELGRFLKFYYEDDVKWTLTIIDGDVVEAKNAERQPFLATDAMQHKASVMAEGLVECIGLPERSVKAYVNYIDTYEQLYKMIPYEYGKNVVILVGCVDNHRARQVMHEAFNRIGDIIYIDSANEFEEGEIVVAAKVKGKEVCPPRGFFFPEVLTDNGKRASELSCGVVNISAPQHLVTNLTAAQHCLSFVVGIMKFHKLECGILHFNAFTHFCRFDRWTEELQKQKVAKEKAKTAKREKVSA